jgi:hypothetical protein
MDSGSGTDDICLCTFIPLCSCTRKIKTRLGIYQELKINQLQPMKKDPKGIGGDFLYNL